MAELAQQFGVSRTPVSEALLLLEQYDMVRFERNRGVRILETSAHDLGEVFALRLLLEVPATRHACAKISAEDVEALGLELDAMRSMVENDQEPAFMAHDKRFHEIILHASGNKRLVATVSHLRDLIRLRGASTVGQSRSLDVIYGEHEAIFDAVRAGDADRAARAMEEHLRGTAELLLDQEGGRRETFAWALVHDLEG